MAYLKPGPLRDAVVLVAVFGLLLGGLFLYTQTWPPAVIVESSSMMHLDNETTYGRIGTIDPGDLVLVKKVDTIDDLETLIDSPNSRYSKGGDVVVYFTKNDRKLTPIIHRAVAYVEVRGVGAEQSFWVRWAADKDCEGGAQKMTKADLDAAEPGTKAASNAGSWCKYDSEGIYIPSIPVQAFGGTPQNPAPYKPSQGGFLTKGDNPFTNRQIDQVSLYSGPPVQLEWIEGKGRGELPWLGLIKLALAGHANERNPPSTWTKIGSAYAPGDLWAMLGISLFVLVGIPLIYDGYKAISVRRGKMNKPGAPRALNASGGPGSVTLTWEAVPRATLYKVYRGADLVGQTNELTLTETNLTPGLAYVYAVTATDPDGKEGPRSRTATAAPTGP